MSEVKNEAEKAQIKYLNETQKAFVKKRRGPNGDGCPWRKPWVKGKKIMSLCAGTDAQCTLTTCPFWYWMNA